MAKCTGIRCPMQYGYKVDECNLEDCPHRTEPMTNADRIRSMTDEELAKWLDNFFWGHKKVSIFDIRKWLQQPAEKTKEELKENV